VFQGPVACLAGGPGDASLGGKRLAVRSSRAAQGAKLEPTVGQGWFGRWCGADCGLRHRACRARRTGESRPCRRQFRSSRHDRRSRLVSYPPGAGNPATMQPRSGFDAVRSERARRFGAGPPGRLRIRFAPRHWVRNGSRLRAPARGGLAGAGFARLRDDTARSLRRALPDGEPTGFPRALTRGAGSRRRIRGIIPAS
jgi:hypothetical protein